MPRLLACVLFLAGVASLLPTARAVTALAPGEVWRDTDGRPINAHGGGILFHEGVYYWYGEFKEGRTYLPKVNKAWGGTRVLAGGVSVYSSRDLVTWKNEGLALPSVPENPDHDLAPENVIERPKVIYNARTKKFVLWFHQDSPNYQAARSGVAVSDTPVGPFKYVGSFRPNAGVRPLNATDADLAAAPGNFLARDLEGGQMARDMTLFVDDDGTAYQFYASESNQTMHVSQLSEDYLRPAGKYARIFVGRSIEAPAVFKRNGRYYLIGSGCTGWDPNPAHAAVADSIFGPWREIGNPCRGEGAEITFGAQSTFVLPVAGRPDLFLAMFDRWNKWNLEDSRYVWLPIEFDAAQNPIIRWQPRWSFPE
ncbi:glycoside hydrolase family 43 protein [Oleiharenicola sp. Vm1]|uniref:glycoside hydrolase family 43 protein n=1 Tax=Oleiharenicola sp. Vm1 TaxID=3398393 RepID=UPI0039F5358E